ncbi:hypothetical protein EYF80_040232 [Liparis tanakae]|uniref:Uncharacterized protein n=1 Tax=Liparis tanakae TaxID=230148 RepID=A0A4Z2G7L5_9TELE|nr:hypothetical protein EYF80_040232 [Liparis tanakae]
MSDSELLLETKKRRRNPSMPIESFPGRYLEPRSASVGLSSTLLRLCSASVSSGTSSSSSSLCMDRR